MQPGCRTQLQRTSLSHGSWIVTMYQQKIARITTLGFVDVVMTGLRNKIELLFVHQFLIVWGLRRKKQLSTLNLRTSNDTVYLSKFSIVERWQICNFEESFALLPAISKIYCIPKGPVILNLLLFVNGTKIRFDGTESFRS